MSLIQAILLGILQGATEFIPVSSSGHLVLVPWLLGWSPAGLTFTLFVHLGTAIGVLAVFWEDWVAMVRGALHWLRTREVNDDFRLALLLVLGVLPVAIIGVIFQVFFEGLFERPLIAMLMLLVTAALLIISERLGKLERNIDDVTWQDSLFIGIAQVLAILPGVSRSGTTIAAARLRNMERDSAARFSFLLATPLIIGAALVQMIELAAGGMNGNSATLIIAGFLAALISAYFVIHWLLAYLRTRSTNVFAVYCVAASLLCIVVFIVRAG